MFSILHPPATSTVYYLSVKASYHDTTEPFAKEFGLQKVMFQVIDHKTHERKSFSGWSTTSLIKITLFEKSLHLIVPLREVNNFISYNGGTIHPSYINYKIKDGREQKKFENFEAKMKAKSP